MEQNILHSSEINLQQVFINRIKRQVAREQELLAKALKLQREHQALNNALEHEAEIEQGLRVVEVSGSVSV